MNNVVTLKSSNGSVVTQDHSKWHYSIDRIRVHLWYGL